MLQGTSLSQYNSKPLDLRLLGAIFLRHTAEAILPVKMRTILDNHQVIGSTINTSMMLFSDLPVHNDDILLNIGHKIETEFFVTLANTRIYK